jgi:apolipoprotein N-acyltransferase
MLLNMPIYISKMSKSMIQSFLLFPFAGVITGMSFLFPETLTSIILGWVVVVALILAVRDSKHILKKFFIFGLLLHVIGFYWVPDTLKLFGGFSYVVSLFLFVLFCIVSSLQFVFCGWLYEQLAKSFFINIHLALPLAWLMSEFLTPRLFPWAISHTQLSFTSFSALAEFVGVYPLSALMFLVVAICFSNNKKLRLALIVFILLLAFGAWRTNEIKALVAPEITVGLIQGNLDVKEKGDMLFFESNISRYQDLSRDAVKKGAQIVFWPESVMTTWTLEHFKNFSGTPYDPWPDKSVPLLYGGLSLRYDSSLLVKMPDDLKPKQFNTAFGIDEKGRVLGRYHKIVLMPFGEYLPFEEYFPMLRTISPHTGEFDVGDLEEPIVFSINNFLENTTLDVSVFPLICYEDLISRLGRLAVSKGANLLVNLTNDAWYGDTVAPRQHHLLAAWRAIETRRYLLRVTNTGYTAIVDATGKTIASLPLFDEAKLVGKIKLFSVNTVYSKIGDIVAWLLVCLGAIGIISGSLYKKMPHND